ALGQIGVAGEFVMGEELPGEGRQAKENCAVAKREFPEAAMMDLQHGKDKGAEECAIVKAQERGTSATRELIVPGQENRRSEQDPIAHQKVISGPQSFVWRGPLPMAVLIKAPERVADISGRKTGKRKRGPAVANQKEDRREGQHQIGIKREQADVGYDGRIISEQHGKES